MSHAASSLELGEFSHIILLASTARAAIAQAAALLASGLRSDVCVTVMGADIALARSICESLSEKFDTGIAENTQDLKNRLWLAETDDAGSMSPAAADHSNFDLSGAHILIVDDDIRNIYSLTSVLESYGVNVVHAERGRDGILILEQMPDIDLALIDIMMPEMDGYETMREIRKRPALADLPLISVTAKAMKGDRQKCLDAGASDYIAKPVDIELLLALLRVWIARSREREAPPLMISAVQ